MKVKIGKYKNWFGPYQLAELICFWVPNKKDEHGFSDKPDWVHKFGEWLAHGSIEPESKVGEITKAFKDRPETWLYKFLLWIDSNKKKRTIKIHIDKWDTWNMDHTLSLIIVPMLKQLKETKHGAPDVDDEDVPEHLRSTAAPRTENEWDTDDNYFKRWDWVIDEMIFAFECKAFDDWNQQFWTGEIDQQWKKLENGNFQVVHGPNHTAKYDAEGADKFHARIKNGFRLFGKYYEGLWD